jgi:hypothetical protein
MFSLQKVDFPVAFSETKYYTQQINDNIVFHVKWLDDNLQFPGLASSTDTDLDGGNWELLERREITEDREEDYAIVFTEDAWSNIINIKDRPSYADIVQKDAAKLQSTKRALELFWPNVQRQKKPKEDITEKDGNDEGDLGTKLLVDYKSQSRAAHRLLRRQNIHKWMITDYYMPGILRLATTTKGWMLPNLAEDIVAPLHYPFMIRYHGIQTESQAKRWSSNFLNFKPDKSLRKQPKVKYDRSECSVLSSIRKRR